jgi:hypothetical protein
MYLVLPSFQEVLQGLDDLDALGIHQCHNTRIHFCPGMDCGWLA